MGKAIYRGIGIGLLALTLLATGFQIGIHSSSLVSNPSQKNEPREGEQDKPYWYQIGKSDVLPAWLTLIITGVVSGVAIATLGDIKKQTRIGLRSSRTARIAAEAARTSADAYVLSERPFVMIETRGIQGHEFWAVNYGKSPAQITFSNRVPFVEAPLLAELPKTLYYGSGFNEPNVQQINVQWIPPQGCYSLGSFDPECMSGISAETVRELNTSTRVLIVYSALKYRGLDGKTYTSTYCYRKYPSGLQMWGSYGWNQYT